MPASFHYFLDWALGNPFGGRIREFFAYMAVTNPVMFGSPGRVLLTIVVVNLLARIFEYFRRLWES